MLCLPLSTSGGSRESVQETEEADPVLSVAAVLAAAATVAAATAAFAAAAVAAAVVASIIGVASEST